MGLGEFWSRFLALASFINMTRVPRYIAKSGSQLKLLTGFSDNSEIQCLSVQMKFRVERDKVVTVYGTYRISYGTLIREDTVLSSSSLISLSTSLHIGQIPSSWLPSLSHE